MKKGLLWLAAGGLWLSAGCSTTSMKGTPFYTGEYEQREGPAADRVNLWPLLYYRDPASSVLWPLMEFSPAHQAVRPVYSGYDLDTDHPVYNVVWPIARFAPAAGDYRIFPVYWGDHYCNVVPFYWHKNLEESGYDALFPLWINSWNRDGRSLHLAWPFYARHRYADWNAWHLWPVYGMKQRPGSLERDIVWPLIHSYTNSTGSGSWAIPLYASSKSDARTSFLSLPYSRSLALKPGEKSWDLAIPLWKRSWAGDQSGWVAIPALSWGRSGKDWSRARYALGLGGWSRPADGVSHHLFPLYGYGSDAEGKHLYTLPWWWKQYADGSGWHALAPIYYRSYSDKRSAFYSLLWLAKKRTDGSGWNAAIPFYYRNSSTNSSAFYSPFWMAEQHPGDTSWQAAFPFYYGAQSAAGSVMITPFYARKLHDDHSVAWRCYIPLVYVNEDYDAHFMTLFGGRWRLGDQQNWIALPLLSGGAKDAGTGRNIYLAGLAGQHWSPEKNSHYVFPLYYRAPQARTLISLPYSTWSGAARQNYAIPPLLTGWYSAGEEARGMIAAGLAGYRKGGDHPYHYLVPFYYTAPQDQSFLSIPYSTWMKGDRKNHLVLPLLSQWYSGESTSGGVFALGLAGYRNGGNYSYNYLLPFYYAAPENHSFFSLPYAAWTTGDRQRHAIPLLLSGWSEAPESKDYLLLGGLGYWRRGMSGVDASHLLPFWMWSKDEYFYSAVYGWNPRKRYYFTPLVGRYEPGSGRSGSWAAPLYWHRRSDSGDVKGWYFPLGYYNNRKERQNHGFFGIYDYYHSIYRWEGRRSGDGEGASFLRESERFHYLLSFGRVEKNRQHAVDSQGNAAELVASSSIRSFFPLWKHQVNDDMISGNRLETSSTLGILYDNRHEQEEREDGEHDYLRRRVLWRLYHYEKLNGDMSTDVFPGITVDSYQNGYYKMSVLWHLFRYERDPENGRTKLDLLFIPLKR